MSPFIHLQLEFRLERKKTYSIRITYYENVTVSYFSSSIKRNGIVNHKCFSFLVNAC